MDLDSILKAALSPDPDERRAAEQRLNQFQCTPQLLVRLLQTVADYKQNNQPMAVGQSLKQPPLFTGTKYFYWKARMKMFIKASHYDVWNVIVDGPHVPSKIVNGQKVPKERNEWEESDSKLIQLNAKAMHILYCSLVENEFVKIATCDSAKEIWDTLEFIHEGTEQVKQQKISMLQNSFDSFSMKRNESINEMFTRFLDITNVLKFLGRPCTNYEMVSKILRSFPKSWNAKVVAILEANDLTKMQLPQLIGSLITHEMKLKEQKAARERNTNTCINIEDGEEEDDSEDDVMALFTREFGRFMQKKKQGGGRNFK